MVHEERARTYAQHIHTRTHTRAHEDTLKNGNPDGRYGNMSALTGRARERVCARACQAGSLVF